MKRWIVFTFAVVVLGNCCFSAIASSDTFPSRPIKLIVVVPAGGGVDAMSRILAEELQNHLGQSVVVENRPGAGTTLGTRDVALAAPDGYTLLVGSTNHMIAPAIYPNLGYDPVKSFSPVAMVTAWSHLLVVRPDLGVGTAKELIDLAKENPGKITFGFGVGTPPQVLGEYWKAVTHVEINSIPYRGSLQAITDMLGGRIDMHFSPISQLLQLVQDGKLKAIAYTGAQRSPQLPDIPTIIESGYPDISFNPDAWLGIMAPAGTPSDILDRLHSAINESLNSSQLKSKFARMGFDVQPTSLEEFRLFLTSEAAKWPAIVRAAGIKSF